MFFHLNLTVLSFGRLIILSFGKYFYIISNLLTYYFIGSYSLIFLKFFVFWFFLNCILIFWMQCFILLFLRILTVSIFFFLFSFSSYILTISSSLFMDLLFWCFVFFYLSSPRRRLSEMPEDQGLFFLIPFWAWGIKSWLEALSLCVNLISYRI